MAIVFAARGNSYDARYSNGGKSGKRLGATGNISQVTDASFLSGGYIQISGAGVSAVVWPGRFNTPNGRAISVLHRMVPLYTGTPAGSRILFPCLSVGPDRIGRIEGYHAVTTGNVTILVVNDSGTTAINSASAGAWSPTSGTAYDLVYTWDGTSNANSFKVYIDGVLLGQLTPSAAWLSSWTNEMFNAISLGAVSATAAIGASRTDELVIWDSVIDPTSVALVSGTGSLNGASRTSLVDVASFDGDSYSNPVFTNVKSGTGYTYAGVSYTGSYLWTTVASADIRAGTSYIANGVTITGSMTGGVSVDPGVGNVRFGVPYMIDGSSLTGTLAVPTASSGTGSAVQLNDIKENIQYILEQANTTTASPIDLSSNLTKRVNRILKVNPEMINPQASFFPLVTCFIREKDIKRDDIARSQIDARRRGTIKISVIGSVWNNNIVSVDEDPADQDINYLMENIEQILRAHYNLGGKVNWQRPAGVKYFTSILDEQTHLRSGILDLDCEVFY